MKRARLPSIRGRLVRALLLWSTLWCIALGLAVWMIVQEEVEELMDDSLQSAAEGLIGPLAQNLMAAGKSAAPPAIASGGGRFMWQVVQHRDGARVLAAARGAPAKPLQASPTVGLSRVPGWRVYGLALGHDGQMVYVAQSGDERYEAKFEVALAVLSAGLPMALLAMLWLSWRVRQELQPLRKLSQRLAFYDPLQPGASLGEADYEELRPVHAAIDALAGRLTRRLAHERAFTSHAAHALRTPLAGIDAQLAVSLREVAPPHRARLQQVRAAAERLARVVAALLAMFRSGAEVHRSTVDLAEFAARLPIDGLLIEVRATAPLAADIDLLAAALLNLLDNSLRHGARTVILSTPAADVLRVEDDGPGVDDVQRQALQQALVEQDYAGRTGLGLMLADLVARAHGGVLQLPQVPSGFAVILRLSARAELSAG